MDPTLLSGNINFYKKLLVDEAIEACEKDIKGNYKHSLVHLGKSQKAQLILKSIDNPFGVSNDDCINPDHRGDTIPIPTVTIDDVTKSCRTITPVLIPEFFHFDTTWFVPLDGAFITTSTELTPTGTTEWIFNQHKASNQEGGLPITPFMSDNLNIVDRVNLSSFELNGDEQRVNVSNQDLDNIATIDISGRQGVNEVDTFVLEGAETVLMNDNGFSNVLIGKELDIAAGSWFNKVNALLEIRSNGWDDAQINTFLIHVLTINNSNTFSGRIISLIGNSTGNDTTVNLVNQLNTFNITVEISWFTLNLTIGNINKQPKL
jgi:hypothetical protein